MAHRAMESSSPLFFTLSSFFLVFFATVWPLWHRSCHTPYPFRNRRKLTKQTEQNSPKSSLRSQLTVQEELDLKDNPTSCVMRTASCVMRHASCVMRHASCVMRHASCVMRHASCVMRHASFGGIVGVGEPNL